MLRVVPRRGSQTPRFGTSTRARLIALLSAFAGALIAVSSLGAAPALAKVKTWTFVIGDDTSVDTLNPYVGLTNPDIEVGGMIYDTLMDYGQNPPYNGTPRLATSWSVSKNGLVWTYHIRHGVYWSDGVPFTAADVAYTYQRAIVSGSTENNATANYVFNITAVKQTGPYTVQMTVSAPTPEMGQLAGVWILPKHIWEHIPEKDVNSYQNLHPVGTGPYTVTSYVPNQSVTLKANPHYWGGAPGIRKLIFEQFNNPSAEAFALENGTIDFAENLSYQLFESLKGKPGITLDPAAAGSFDELAFNTGAKTVDNKPIGNGNPALKDVKVRQALSWAVDPSTLVRKVFLGYALPGTSVIPPMYPNFFYHPPASIAYHYDPAKAEQILDADGWKLGPAGYRYKDGKELSLRLFDRSASPTDTQDGPYIVAWLRAVGVNVKESLLADSELTAAITNGNYDLFIWGWSVEPNPNFQLSTMTCGQRSYGPLKNLTAGWSDSFYCDPTYDKLWAEQQTLAGAARQRIVQQMQHQVYVQAPYRVLYYYYDDQAYRSDLFTGFAPQPGNVSSGLLLFQETAWWSYRCLRPVGTSPSLTDHNIGCQELLKPTKTELQAAGISGSPLSGGAVVLILGLFVVGGLAIWWLYERHDAATADERE